MASGERNRTQERRRTLIILTAKITEESVMETKIDEDGNENRACRAGEQRKEDQKMKTMKRKHAFVNGEETIWDI